MKYIIILIILIGCSSNEDRDAFYTDLCNRKAYQSFKYGYWQAINDVGANYAVTGDIVGDILDSLYWLRLEKTQKQFNIKERNE